MTNKPFQWQPVPVEDPSKLFDELHTLTQAVQYAVPTEGDNNSLLIHDALYQLHAGLHQLREHFYGVATFDDGSFKTGDLLSPEEFKSIGE